MKKLAALLLLVVGAGAQTKYPSPLAGVPYDQAETLVPTTATLIACTTAAPCATGYAFVDAWKFYNTTGASITVTISDTSTACGGSSCTHSYPIAANSEWYPQRHGERYAGGIKWSASAAGLEGWITWRQ